MARFPFIIIKLFLCFFWPFFLFSSLFPYGNPSAFSHFICRPIRAAFYTPVSFISAYKLQYTKIFQFSHFSLWHSPICSSCLLHWHSPFSPSWQSCRSSFNFAKLPSPFAHPFSFLAYATRSNIPYGLSYSLQNTPFPTLQHTYSVVFSLSAINPCTGFFLFYTKKMPPEAASFQDFS